MVRRNWHAVVINRSPASVFRILISLCLILPGVSGGGVILCECVGRDRAQKSNHHSDRWKRHSRLQLTSNSDEVNVPKSKSSGSIVVEHPIVRYDESLRINTPYVLCESGGSHYSWLRLESFSTKEILHHGDVSPNTCDRVTVSPHPGQVILFVRPLTWWEKLKQ